MKRKIRELKRGKLVILLTGVSCTLAIVMDILIAGLFDHVITWHEDIVRASIIALFITPFLSWYLLGILIELNNLQKETDKLATYDSLTNIYNRRVFLQSCKNLHHLARRNKNPYSFFVIDIDLFKKINDTYGHPCGDLVLSSLGQLFTSVSRKSDLIGRLGGEEFGFLLPDTNHKQATEYAQKLQGEINALEIKYETNTIKTTVSIGIFINTFDNNFSLEEIYKLADKALYLAKESGKNQFAYT